MNSMNAKKTSGKSAADAIWRGLAGLIASSANVGTSNPSTSAPEARLWLRMFPSSAAVGIVPISARSRLTANAHHNTLCLRQTILAPSPIAPRRDSIACLPSRGPRQKLSRKLPHEKPVRRELARGAVVGFGGQAVVEEVFVEADFVRRVHLRRNQFRLLKIREARPAVSSVPLLADTGSVVEAVLDLHRKEEIALAVNDHGVFIKRLTFLRRQEIPLVPIRAVRAHVKDFVVENVRPIDRLVEVPAEVLSRNFFDGLQKVLPGRMREAGALE